MMQPCGERDVTEVDLSAFEGLVHSTARMFAKQVKREEEDLAQELRIVAWRALRKYDPERSSLSLERYVFGCISNKIRDYKRDAARRANYGLSFLHIEDMRSLYSENKQEVFDARFHFVTRESVYGRVDGELYALPASVTEPEANVLVLMLMELSEREIMLRLSLTRDALELMLAALREKFADCNPAERTLTAELGLVESRAA